MEKQDKLTIPENFRTILTDFLKDLTLTFPDYSERWEKWESPDMPECELYNVFEYSLSVYPERFFDIIYQNEDIFKEDSKLNTFFLPEVDFALLYNCVGVSENTKKTMWKYLQLILFTVIGAVKDKSTFGESINLFDGIDEAELQDKLQETMSGITDFFSNVSKQADAAECDSSSGSEVPEAPEFNKFFENMPKPEDFKKAFDGKNMPDMENIQDHLKNIFNGKIGSLAKEMAEEITDDFKDILGDDMSDMNSTGDVMKKLMKNPKKIMDLMKTVSSKLDSKMKSGEISKDEIMKEAGDLINKMKDMGGADQFKEMFANLTKNMGGFGKDVRMDTNAMSRMTKNQSMRERLLKKMEAKKAVASQQPQVPATYSLLDTNQTNNLVFRINDEESQSKSYIHPDILAEMEKESVQKSSSSGKNKKKKKNKNKK
jgi:hypothetical protein